MGDDSTPELTLTKEQAIELSDILRDDIEEARTALDMHNLQRVLLTDDSVKKAITGITDASELLAWVDAFIHDRVTEIQYHVMEPFITNKQQ